MRILNDEERKTARELLLTTLRATNFDHEQAALRLAVQIVEERVDAKADCDKRCDQMAKDVSAFKAAQEATTKQMIQEQYAAGVLQGRKECFNIYRGAQRLVGAPDPSLNV